VNTLQLVDTVERGTYERLRAELPGIKLIQVVHVTGPEAVEEAVRVAPSVDAVLLDSGDPRRAVKQLGERRGSMTGR
jgi:phosphoribosylanthranilate isomerase